MSSKPTKKVLKTPVFSTGRWAKDFQKLPENIQDSISKLSENLQKKEQKKSVQQLTKEFVEIFNTNKDVRKVLGEQFKYQKTLAILSNRYTPPQVDLEDIIHKEPLDHVEKKKIERLAKANFRSQNLMFMIRRELEKDHVGDSKGKLTAFLAACSGKLPAKYRISIALRGDSSVGKTNLQNVALRHLPKHWYAFGTRFTRASLEDDVKPFHTIAFSEKTQDDQTVIESLKQLTEDGMQIWKHDKDTNKLREVEFIERKATIYSSTEKETDDELSTRYIVYTITRHPYKINKVIESIKDNYGNAKKLFEEERREKKPTWITVGLKGLKDFDKIVIPYSKLICFSNDYPRCQRDAKRFLNLVSVSAWINQYNRIYYEDKGKKILIADVDDFFWASFLTVDIFKQTLTNIDKDIEALVKMYRDMVAKGNIVILSGSEEATPLTKKSSMPWVRRSDLIQEMDISLNTLKKRCSVLKDKGILFEHYERRGNKSYISINTNPIIITLLKYNPEKMYFVMKNIEDNILKNIIQTLNGKRPTVGTSVVYKNIIKYKPNIDFSIDGKGKLIIKSKSRINKEIREMVEYINKNLISKRTLNENFDIDEFTDESDIDWEI